MLLQVILDLPSVDSDGVCRAVRFGSCAENCTVRNALARKLVTSVYHKAIAAAMKRDGYNSVPIHIGRADDLCFGYDVARPACITPDQVMVGNGSHRIKIAYRLGLAAMRWTDEYDESNG